MMQYYFIQNSLDEKTMGKLPQIKEINHYCDVWNNPIFIDRFPFKKIEIEPILSHPILFQKSSRTDLIDVGGIGFSFGSLFVSKKLKKILEESNHFGVQFFKTKLFQGNTEFSDYWQTHIYDIPSNYINFEKTKVILKDRDENRKIIIKELEIYTKDDFTTFKECLKYPRTVSLKNIFFNSEFNLDYFFLQYSNGNNGIVSERLKNKMEEEECTGIEFRPLEVDLNDWFGSNGIREKNYRRIPQMRPDGSIRE